MLDTATQEIDFLIESARHDSDALGDLLMRFFDCLVEVAAQRLHCAVAPKCDPADVAQETIEAALSGYKKFRGKTKREFIAWLTQIHRRSIYDVHDEYFGRKKKDLRREIPLYDRNRTTLVWIDVANNDTSLTQRDMRLDRAMLLVDALRRLPESQQVAVRLRHLRGWSLEAISIKLGCSESAAAGYIKRGLKRLNALLPPEARP